MVDVNRLRGIICEKGYSQAQMARKIGISDRTFYLKMHKKVFTSDEIYKIKKILSLSVKDTVSIFFADKVT